MQGNIVRDSLGLNRVNSESYYCSTGLRILLCCPKSNECVVDNSKYDIHPFSLTIISTSVLVKLALQNLTPITLSFLFIVLAISLYRTQIIKGSR